MAQCSGAVRMALLTKHTFLVSCQTYNHLAGFLFLAGKKQVKKSKLCSPNV